MVVARDEREWCMLLSVAKEEGRKERDVQNFPHKYIAKSKV
jgi:hypothetical protein